MKRAYCIAGSILAVLCVLCLVLLLYPQEAETEAEPVSTAEETVQAAVTEAYAAAEPEEEPAPEPEEEEPEEEEPEPEAAEEPEEAPEEEAPEPEEAEEPEEEAEPYVSPVDFESLQAVNPDVYAWIYIPGTEINYPVLQSDTDDDWYLTHNAAGEYASAGAIFSQATYNSKDFTDPVTILYGHRRSDGTMFSQLQALYSADGGIDTYSQIIIYLPDREITYTVFAAVPFEKWHILYNYNFENTGMYSSFLKTVLNIRDLNAQFSDTVEVDTEDRLLILSTCLYGNAQKRYLILAREDSDIAASAADTAETVEAAAQ